MGYRAKLLTVAIIVMLFTSHLSRVVVYRMRDVTNLSQATLTLVPKSVSWLSSGYSSMIRALINACTSKRRFRGHRAPNRDAEGREKFSGSKGNVVFFSGGKLLNGWWPHAARELSSEAFAKS